MLICGPQKRLMLMIREFSLPLKKMMKMAHLRTLKGVQPQARTVEMKTAGCLKASEHITIIYD